MDIQNAKSRKINWKISFHKLIFLAKVQNVQKVNEETRLMLELTEWSENTEKMSLRSFYIKEQGFGLVYSLSGID